MMPSNNELILVVDDLPTNIQVLGTILQEKGYRISIADSGAKAIKVLEKNIPDLILLDVMMPEMDGFQTCKLIKENPETKDIPIIFLSALNDTVNKVEGFKLGAIDYLTKPFEPEEVLIRIETHLSIRKLQTQLENFNHTLEEKIKERTEELTVYKNHLEDLVEHRTNDLRLSLEELKKSQKRLIESEKMAALGQLVTGVAHEVNTPLGISITYASHLQELIGLLNEDIVSSNLTKTVLDSFVKNGITSTELLLKNLNNASKIISNFKQIAVDHSTEVMRKFNLKEYIMMVIEDFSTILKLHKYDITIECTDDIEVYSYPGVIATIITNLIDNSIIHGFHGMDIGCIKIKIFTKDENIHFIYSDDGIGIPQEELKKIFDPFFTTRRGIGHHGLGMNILYNQVSRILNGTVTCSSELNQGIKVEIQFPIKADQNVK